MTRNPTKQIMVGPVAVGGGAPVSIQSMCNTDTRDATATLAQIRELAVNGCEIIRVAVPDFQAAESLRDIVRDSPLPVIADIHFDYRLALAAIRAGAASIRLNPGNIGDRDRVRKVAEAAGEAGIPIRVGANGGSVSPALLENLVSSGMSPEEALPEALVRSVLEECAQLESFGFRRIKVSLKSSRVVSTVAACRRFAERSDYPQHIGVTEAGTPANGVVKSAVGIGALLLDGIGDTLRVSLTAPPLQEVISARRILEACGLRSAEPEIVSCPTCGRTGIDLISLAERVESAVRRLQGSGRRIPLRKIAVMGCVVNGPGEARDADIGLAGGDGKVVLFRNGQIQATYPEEEGIRYLESELERISVPR